MCLIELFVVKYLNNNYKYNKAIISIYLPIYNKEKYLFKSIKSIQKQTLKNIEIVAVNDCSNDNSLKILKKLAMKDSRIKIINNKKNRGLLFSRAMGIINSSGKYLMNLDPDDQLASDNDLKYLYKIIKKRKVDVITFAYLEKGKVTLKCSNFNKVLKQPKLFNSTFNQRNNYIIDYVLWNKLIKRNLLIKVYKFFKKKIYSNKWNYGEDTIWSLLINKYAKSMICTNKTIYLYKTNVDSLMNNRNNYMEIKNRIYILKMYKEIFRSKKERKYLCAHILQFIFELKKDKLLSIIKDNNDINQKIIELLKPFFNKYYCSENVFQKIKTFINIYDCNLKENNS